MYIEIIVESEKSYHLGVSIKLHLCSLCVCEWVGRVIEHLRQ